MDNKMIRKLIALSLCIALVLFLAACSTGEKDDPAVGAYEFVSMNAAGMEIDKESASTLGLDVSGFSLEIKEDGTFIMKMEMPGMDAPEEGEEDSGKGTWKNEGGSYILTADGEDVTGKYDASAKTFTFTMEDAGENVGLVFKKK